jgi:hypothetical protein
VELGYNLINGKQVFISAKHHEVLHAWADYRRKVAEAPIAITLDHHTDTIDAFRGADFDPDKLERNTALYEQFIREMDYRNPSSINDAIMKLRHDEHIDAALKTDILRKAFVICYDAYDDKPPPNELTAFLEKYHNIWQVYRHKERPKRPYTYPESGIYVVENLCSMGCTKQTHDDNCTILHYNQAIESVLLENKLSIISEMAPGMIKNNRFTRDYILDIDLDYFHTCDSIQPKDHATFHELIRNASLITVATEEDFIEDWQKTCDSSLTVDFLLEHLEQHIRQAME